jgi:hypothetical protein
MSAKAEQKVLVRTGLELMHVLGFAATALARLPASIKAPDVTDGMSFTMLRGVEPLLGGRVEGRILHEQLHALANAAPRLPAILEDASTRLAALAAGFALEGA